MNKARRHVADLKVELAHMAAIDESYTLGGKVWLGDQMSFYEADCVSLDEARRLMLKAACFYEMVSLVIVNSKGFLVDICDLNPGDTLDDISLGEAA